MLCVSILFLVCCILGLSHRSNAYHVGPAWRSRSTSHQHRLVLDMTQRSGMGDSSSDGMFDIEDAREKLESLLKATDDKDDNEQKRKKRLGESTVSRAAKARSYQSLTASLTQLPLPEPPLLTSIERERRLAEIEAIQNLEQSDEALTDLWVLWFSERGTESAHRLKQAEELASHPRTWKIAEAAYRELITTYGVHWTEPVNKLATLYFLQGRLEESAALCKVVLAIKPWHVGALSGIVAVYAGLQDLDKTRHWSLCRLPMMSPMGSSNQRRKEWVERTVRKAKASLLEAEQRLLESFGRQDQRNDVNTDIKHRYCNELDDKDSWQ